MTVHDPSKVVMGSTQSNIREITNHKGVIEAGLAVRLKSDDTISVLEADGSLIGISVGRDLSDTPRTAICRKGVRVPVKLATGFNPVIGAVVNLSDTTGEAVASGAGATAVNATYSSGRLGGSGENGGVGEDGVMKGVAFIDFPGGL